MTFLTILSPGADPGGAGGMPPQTAMFPIVNSSAKKLFI